MKVGFYYSWESSCKRGYELAFVIFIILIIPNNMKYESRVFNNIYINFMQILQKAFLRMDDLHIFLDSFYVLKLVIFLCCY